MSTPLAALNKVSPHHPTQRSGQTPIVGSYTAWTQSGPFAFIWAKIRVIGRRLEAVPRDGRYPDCLRTVINASKRVCDAQ